MNEKLGAPMGVYKSQNLATISSEDSSSNHLAPISSEDTTSSDSFESEAESSAEEDLKGGDRNNKDLPSDKRTHNNGGSKPEDYMLLRFRDLLEIVPTVFIAVIIAEKSGDAVCTPTLNQAADVTQTWTINHAKDKYVVFCLV